MSDTPSGALMCPAASTQLRPALTAMRQLLSGEIKTRSFLVASFDPGAGKTGALCAFLKSWKSSSFQPPRSEEHTSELQSLMRISYAVFCLKKKKNIHTHLQPSPKPP